jgi:hypothetical protein
MKNKLINNARERPGTYMIKSMVIIEIIAPTNMGKWRDLSLSET